MLLTGLPFDYTTILEIGDRSRRAPRFSSGTRVRRTAARGKK